MDDQTGGGGGYPQPPQPVQVPQAPEPPRRRGSGARAGVWLIIIGLVVLAAQFIPGLAWWNLWPLIIVAAGAIQAFTPGEEGWGVNRVFDGLVTVAWGLVFLAITLGYVGWGVMWSIFRLWPVLLIALGFELLGKALHQSWIRALGSIAVIAALAYAVGTAGGFVGPAWQTSNEITGEQTVSEPVAGAEKARLDLDVGAAELRLASGAELVEVDSSGMGSPRLSVARTGSSAHARVITPDESDSWVWPGSGDRRLDVLLSNAVVWDLRLEAGAASVDADLRDIPVGSFSLKPGVADCTVRLGEPLEAGRTVARVEGGVSSIKLLVPRGAEARVTSESGLVGHTIRGDFESEGGNVWSTPGYEQAAASGSPVWDITLNTGIGAVTVDTY